MPPSQKIRVKKLLRLLHQIQHASGPDDLTGKQRMELFNIQLRLERKVQK